MAIFDKVDFEIQFDYPPVVQQYKQMSFETLKVGELRNQQLNVRKNRLFLDDNYIPLPWNSYEGEFMDMGDFISTTAPAKKSNPDLLFELQIGSHDSFVVHSRSIFGVLSLLGDLGGVQAVLLSIFALFMSPISEFCFQLKAIQQIFIARCSDFDIFKAVKV